MPSLMWFRRDLRLDDNPALVEAAADGPVLPLFVLDPALWGPAGPARRAYLGASLRALDAPVVVLRGDPVRRVVEAAREVGVPVVHCTFVRRSDGRGSSENAPLFRVMPKLGVRLEPGSREAQVIPELGPAAGDLVLERRHGVGPMGWTDLDAVCRNLGATTIVGIGVSVNVGITSLVMDAVNLGYRVVVPRDAVAGAPVSYADAVIEGTLTLLATIVDTDDLVAVWSRGVRDGRR